MSKYIDVGKQLVRLYRLGLSCEDVVKQFLLTAPTADVVEVVRCKDCRWGRKVCGNIECSSDLNVPTEYHGYDWFCPNGERMDGEKRDE